MSDACPHPREGGKPARGGPGWEHTAGSLPRRGICRVRPLRKGWVVGHHMACHWGGGTNPSPFPPYPKMRKYALPALPRLPLGGGSPLFVRPAEQGQGNERGDTAPNPSPDPDPTASSPTCAMLGTCPGGGYLNDHPAVGPPPHAPHHRLSPAKGRCCPQRLSPGRAPSPAPDSCPCRGVGWPPYVPAESLAFMGLPPNPHLSSCSPSQSPRPIKPAPC